MVSKRSWSDEDLISAVARAKCMADVLRYLGVKPKGSSYLTARKYISEMNLSTSHFDPAANRSPRFRQPAAPIESFLVVGKYVSSAHLRKRLIREGLLVDQCFFDDCPTRSGNMWRGQPIGLQLDHINGDRFDNRLENLRLLCPKCHTQTPNYAGRNMLRKAAKSRCIDCKRVVSKGCVRCIPCYAVFQRHIDWPPLDVLLDMLSKSNYTAVGRQLGVTDNAVRKAVKRMSKS